MPNLRDLDVQWVSLVDRAAVRNAENPTEAQRFILWKAENRDDTDPKGGSMTEAEMVAAVDKAETERDGLQEQLTKAETERDELNERVEKLEKAADPDKPEPEPVINKADLPEPVRKALEKAEEAEKVAKAEREALAKRVEDSETIAKAERDLRVTREFVTKAEGYRHLMIKAEKFGPVLKAASETLSKEAYEAIETVLKAADNQVDANNMLLKSLGQDGEPDGGGGGSDLARKAEEIQKADPSITRTEAMRRAAKGDPAAQATYLETVR